MGPDTDQSPSSEFEIVEQPVVPLIQELVDYWQQKRRGRMVPARSDIDPMELRPHLPHIFMMDVLDGGLDFRFRLVGTSIVQGLGHDNTGKTLSELYGDRPDVLRKILARFILAVQERRPIFARGNIWWLPDRSFHRYAIGLLPLSSDGATVDIILAELFVS
jgi:hypothetical protein